MSPISKNDDNILTVSGGFQSTGYTNQDDESQYDWNDTLCILRPSDEGRPQRFICISDDIHVREMDKIFGPKIDPNKTFFKMRVGTKMGSSWCKLLDWEIEDYESVLGDEKIMYSLRHYITPNPTYIEEMISILRELKINRIIENDTNIR